MNVLIVDDEPLARRELRRLLAAHPWIQVIGEAGDVEDAAERISELSPEVVFLDIQMPGGSGFDVLERLDCPPRVIFTTAYDTFAIKAFDVNALDYLLKPIEPERLATALEKLQTALPSSAARSDGDVVIEQLFVRDGPRCWFVPLSEVSVFTAEGNAVRLHWRKVRPLLARSLLVLESKLDGRRFFRANRRQIVNLTHIRAVEPGPGGRLYVELNDDVEVEISRRQARVLRSRTTI